MQLSGACHDATAPFARTKGRLAESSGLISLLPSRVFPHFSQASQPREYLFGHLSPPYVLEELKVLADLVQAERERRRRRWRGAADPGSGTEADEEAAAGAGDGPPLRGVKGE